VTQSDRTKSTRSKGTDTDSSNSLFTDLLRRATSPEVLAGVAGAAAAAHFTKHAVDRSNGEVSEASAEPAEDTAFDADGEEDGPEGESAEAAEDGHADEPDDSAEPEDEQDDEPEDESAPNLEDEEPEEPEDEPVEDAEDAQDAEPEDEETDDGPNDSGEDEATEPRNVEGGDESPDESRSHNGSLGEDDERMQLLARARQYAEEFTGHPVESFSGLAQEDRGWRVGLEVVEVSRVPSTTDVLASYEVVLTGEGDLVDFRRAGRYYRNATDGISG